MSSFPKSDFFNVTSPQEWVAHVETNRADKLNTFRPPMWEDLKRIFDHLSRDESIRAVILSAAGTRAFSAGLDVKWAASDTSTFSPAANDPRDGARRAVAIRRGALDFQDCISAIEKCEKPVICVLHGLALGISIDISTCADIRICTSDVRFSVKEVDIGLAADVGTLSRLPKVVGHYGWVKEVSMTAREFGAEEALRVGFVNRVLPTKDEAIKSALELGVFLASKSPVAVQGTKEFLDHARDHTVADSLKYTAVWNAGAVQTKDVPIALEAALSKKTPKFEKL